MSNNECQDCSDCWATVHDWIQAQDILYDPTYMNFHFDSDQKNKSLCGGTLSLLIKLYVLVVAIGVAGAAFSREEP